MPVLSQNVAVACRVEVSGWDSKQEFFVEGTELQSTEDGVAWRVVVLAVVHPTSVDRVHPVPYQADPLEAAGDGQHLVKPVQARLRQRASRSTIPF